MTRWLFAREQLSADVEATLVPPEDAWKTGVVEPGVEWGVVTLRGRVPLRSQAGAIAESVARVDGVIAVEDEVEWDFDDAIADALPY